LPLREKYPGFRWLSKDMLHITTAFLGETDEKALPVIIEAVRAASVFPKIIGESGKLLTLPKNRPPNVLAIQIEKGGTVIAALAADTIRSLEVSGIIADEKRRDFLPHITLARGLTGNFSVKDEPPIVLECVFKNLNVYESKLSGQGARYSLLASFPLTGANK